MARLCLTRTENTALLRGWASEAQTPRGSCQVEGSPRLPAFTSLVLGLAVMRRRARTFNCLGQKGFFIRQTAGGENGGWGVRLSLEGASRKEAEPGPVGQSPSTPSPLTPQALHLHPSPTHAISTTA